MHAVLQSPFVGSTEADNNILYFRYTNLSDILLVRSRRGAKRRSSPVQLAVAQGRQARRQPAPPCTAVRRERGRHWRLQDGSIPPPAEAAGEGVPAKKKPKREKVKKPKPEAEANGATAQKQPKQKKAKGPR